MNMNWGESARVLAGLRNTRKYSYVSKVQVASSDTTNHCYKGCSYD